MSENNSESEESLAEALSKTYDDLEGDSVKEEAPEPEPAVEAAKEDPAVEVEKQAEEVIPPEHWSDEDKLFFTSTDDSGREWALRLEANASKGIQQKSEELKKFRDVIEPYKYLFNGADETQAIQNLLNAQASLIRDPINGIKWLMKNLGIDEKQFQPSEPTDEDEFLDPELKKLRTEVSSLKDAGEQRARQAVQDQQNAMFAQLAEFRDAVDGDGDKTHPHFQEVYGVMAGLLQSGRAADLEAAYDQAVLTVPEHMDSVVQKRLEEKAKEEADQRAKDAEEAKKKATTVQGKTSAKPPQKDQSLKSALSEAYDKSIKGEL